MKALILDKSAIKENLQTIRKCAGVPVIADLSGDGQGVGVPELAALLRDEGVRSFAVSEVWDAQTLRKNHFEEEQILMLRCTSDADELEQLLDLGAVCTVGSLDSAVALNGIAEARSTVVEVQLEIDVGLAGYGFQPTEMEKISNVFRHMPCLAVVGMFARMSAPWKAKAQAQAQIDAFEGVLEKLQSAGYDTGTAHILDSVGAMRFDEGRLDAVRAGSGLIGRLPGRSGYGLTPVGYIEADVEEIEWVAKGRHVGPGGEHVMRKSGKVGVIAVGWCNGLGLARERGQENLKSLPERLRGLFSGKPLYEPYIKVGGKRVHVLGRVGMTYTLIDVTDVDCTNGSKAYIEADPRLVKGLPRTYR